MPHFPSDQLAAERQALSALDDEINSLGVEQVLLSRLLLTRANLNDASSIDDSAKDLKQFLERRTNAYKLRACRSEVGADFWVIARSGAYRRAMIRVVLALHEGAKSLDDLSEILRESFVFSINELADTKRFVDSHSSLMAMLLPSAGKDPTDLVALADSAYSICSCWKLAALPQKDSFMPKVVLARVNTVFPPAEVHAEIVEVEEEDSNQKEMFDSWIAGDVIRIINEEIGWAGDANVALTLKCDALVRCKVKERDQMPGDWIACFAELVDAGPMSTKRNGRGFAYFLRFLSPFTFACRIVTEQLAGQQLHVRPESFRTPNGPGVDLSDIVDTGSIIKFTCMETDHPSRWVAQAVTVLPSVDIDNTSLPNLRCGVIDAEIGSRRELPLACLCVKLKLTGIFGEMDYAQLVDFVKKYSLRYKIHKNGCVSRRPVDQRRVVGKLMELVKKSPIKLEHLADTIETQIKSSAAPGFISKYYGNSTPDNVHRFLEDFDSIFSFSNGKITA